MAVLATSVDCNTSAQAGRPPEYILLKRCCLDMNGGVNLFCIFNRSTVWEYLKVENSDFCEAVAQMSGQLVEHLFASCQSLCGLGESTGGKVTSNGTLSVW